ncbi:DUF2285 domain-containing protein [Mesorhizobium australicum]|uniref:DUF2285 domain-containing protein n=1 Tax=Mesorhizobium australicum TaxID=536018 RepID=UPI00333C34CB
MAKHFRENHILIDTPDGAQSIDAMVLPLDENFEIRLDAARRFWRALNGRPPGVPFGSLPQQTKLRHILNLRAHDARQAKAAYPPSGAFDTPVLICISPPSHGKISRYERPLTGVSSFTSGQ